MKYVFALVSGLVGASVVTLLNETVRRFVPEAPRLDILGMRATAKTLRLAGEDPPVGTRLRRRALVGDIGANSLYFSLVGAGAADQKTWLRGMLLGLAAGIGAVILPPFLGLGEIPTNRSRRTQVMTILMYLYGGLTAAFTFQWLAGRRQSEPNQDSG